MLSGRYAHAGGVPICSTGYLPECCHILRSVDEWISRMVPTDLPIRLQYILIGYLRSRCLPRCLRITLARVKRSEWKRVLQRADAAVSEEKPIDETIPSVEKETAKPNTSTASSVIDEGRKNPPRKDNDEKTEVEIDPRKLALFKAPHFLTRGCIKATPRDEAAVESSRIRGPKDRG